MAKNWKSISEIRPVWGTLFFIYFVINRDNIVNYFIHFTFYKLDWIYNQPGFWLDSWKSHMRVIRIYDAMIEKWFWRRDLHLEWIKDLLTKQLNILNSKVSSDRISLFFVNSFSWFKVNSSNWNLEKVIIHQ